MNELTPEDVCMDARKWIEFGKMYNNIIQEGWEIVLDSTYEEDGTKYRVDIFTPDEEFDDKEYYVNPYEAMKVMYFKYYLDCESENISFDIPNNILKELFIEADTLGITLDELIINILSDTFNKDSLKFIDPDCCNQCEEVPPVIKEKTVNHRCIHCEHCITYSDLKYPICLLYKIELKENFPSCSNFKLI
jgi:hypothetical protein